MSRSAVPGPAWWCEDPELWELPSFEGRYDERGLSVDVHREDRRHALQALIRAPARECGDFARFLLAQEIRWHRHCRGFDSGIEMAAAPPHQAVSRRDRRRGEGGRGWPRAARTAADTGPWREAR